MDTEFIVGPDTAHLLPDNEQVDYIDERVNEMIVDMLELSATVDELVVRDSELIFFTVLNNIGYSIDDIADDLEIIADYDNSHKLQFGTDIHEIVTAFEARFVRINTLLRDIREHFEREPVESNEQTVTDERTREMELDLYDTYPF